MFYFGNRRFSRNVHITDVNSLVSVVRPLSCKICTTCNLCEFKRKGGLSAHNSCCLFMACVDVSVIIVTFNSAAHIERCVRSVQTQRGITFEIIVVDNASADGTLKQLEKLNCRILANPRNLGFGQGNNLGFRSCNGRYIYLLNPDARLTAPDALARICRRMEANPRWGMAGTSIRSSEGQTESPPAFGYPGSRHVHRDFSQLPGKIAWVMGASMFIRRELYEMLRGFDPDFFLYSEETDFCLRMRELGFEIGHVPEVAVEHVGAASEDTQDPYELSARKLRGLLRFRQKHYPPEDCIFLAKRDLYRAKFRMHWNASLALFQARRSKWWRKSRVYRAISEVSRQFLEMKRRQVNIPVRRKSGTTSEQEAIQITQASHHKDR